MTLPSLFVGCDVGKAEIAVCISPGEHSFILPNRTDALARFARELDPACLIVCEATGGYETALLEAACNANRAIHRADARKVKAFIRSFGTLAKTDAIDARALARYGAERHDRLARWQPPGPEQAQLQALVMARRDLVAARTAWNNRRKAPTAQTLGDLLDPIVKTFDAQLKIIDQALARLVRNARLAARMRVLQSIPGIGAITAYSLQALMPELGSITRKNAASLAGLAPHPRQSGQHEHYRKTRGGRPLVRHAMFMATFAAIRSNQNIRDFYQRLIANGKKPIVAVVAAMRKLITIANATLKSAQLS
jgi:transposase